MRQEHRDGYDFVSMLYPFYRKDAIQIVTDNYPIESYQTYIAEHGIEMAEIIMPDLRFLLSCPTLKHLRIIPSYDSPDEFDFTPLYELPEIMSLNCQNQYGDKMQHMGIIDYSKIQGLVNLFVSVNRGAVNFDKVESLKTLDVGGFRGKRRDLSDLFCSKELDTLRLIDCGIHSLDGIETSHKMQCLYLHYNRSLHDISSLCNVGQTLRALRIENCSKIRDFSVLAELENLELLELSGSNTLPNLDFLKSMKNLKTFIFNMNVLNGDLTPCLALSYVYSEKDRKHYNLKDIDLPKGHYARGNESIEDWRRFE